MKEISILLGSGFSAPDGVKTVGEINKYILSLKLEDIYIHTDMTLLVVDGCEKPVSSIHYGDELFFIELISFYNQTVDSFNYEKFYDFVTSFNRFQTNRDVLEAFFAKFKKEQLNSDHPLDGIHSYMSRFVGYFNNLISILLNSAKYYEDVTLINYENYERFAKKLKSLIEEGYLIHIHSLNHDLLFEHFASKHVDLLQYFTDGYSEHGSEYYGRIKLNQSISKSYRVRLKRFVNDYDNNLRLYKLHGSVDTYIANIYTPNLDLTRVKKDWGVGEIEKEVETKLGKLEYQSMFQKEYPEILSGASSKAFWYKQTYYKELHEYFTNNLKNSVALIVIGYGFGDDGINNQIENEFLVDGKKMCVIDINMPKSRLFNDYKTQFINKSISLVSEEEWDTIIN
jgi:hypothetical protein